MRPTTDRVRETLFNWLQLHIVNAHCLDAFAGSGILGFEALSREAKSVVAIEQSPLAYKTLVDNARQLSATNFQAMQQDCLDYLQKCHTTFDVIFLDPPFNHTVLLQQALIKIQKHNLLNENGLIYVELPEKKVTELEQACEDLHWLKRKKAGQVCYALVKF